MLQVYPWKSVQIRGGLEAFDPPSAPVSFILFYRSPNARRQTQAAVES
jgi:hypothetical protein